MRSYAAANREPRTVGLGPTSCWYSMSLVSRKRWLRPASRVVVSPQFSIVMGYSLISANSTRSV